MEQDIDEVKELAKKNLALAQDTNRIMHKMQRAARWGRFFQIVWWIAILAVSSAAYYYYLQPYVHKIEDVYSNFQASGQKAQSIGQQIENLFKSFGSSSPQNVTTPQQ